MSGKGKKAAAPKKKANKYKMPAPIPIGEIINDTLGKRKWRIGPSIGVGGFGEIYSACDHDTSPIKCSNYPFVIKIEPHENGPLFVEKHFYVRNANKDDIVNYMKLKNLKTLGMPQYYGNGSHTFKGENYRFLVLERYGKDLWSIFKEVGCSFPPATVFKIAIQMLDVLEYIHFKGYIHADIKGANILLGLKKGTENQAYLVDFGLATKINDKEFKPDPKCAHNGTIEYTSRDAHLGVPTVRGDLEILSFNMLQWLAGELPWEKYLKEPKTVQTMKETFMKDVESETKKVFPNAPDALIKFFKYINTLKPKDNVDYSKCREIFESYLNSNGIKNNKLDFKKASENGKDSTDLTDTDKKTGSKRQSPQNREIPMKRNRRNAKPKENCENEEPDLSLQELSQKAKKRKSLEPALVIKVKKTKMTPKATPPPKKNFSNIATQTSIEKPRRSPRQVSFDSPVCEIINEKKLLQNGKDENPLDASPDMFEESFEKKKVKPRRKLLSDEEFSVKRVIKKKSTTIKKGKSWKDAPTVTNGRSPPK